MAGPEDWGAVPVEQSGGPEAWGAVPVEEPPQKIPQAFLDRVQRGAEIADTIKQDAGASFEERFAPAGSDAFESAAARMRKANPTHPRGSMLTLMPQIAGNIAYGLTIGPIIAAKDLTQRALGGDIVSDDPQSIADAANAAGLALPFHSGRPNVSLETFSRLHPTAAGVEHQPIGPLPNPEDFHNAATVLDSPVAEENLRDLWDDHGVHPAEAAHDAQADAYLKHELTTPPDPVTRIPESEWFGDRLAAKTYEAPFTVYHGSPHSFEVFDTGKIGSGEGAQAYGHGLYFAENPAVAGIYKERLAAKKGGLSPQGQTEIRHEDGMWNVYVDGQIENGFGAKSDAERFINKGTLYQVKINADREHFLDWDKKLGEQTPEVKAALKKLGWDADSYTLPDGRLAPKIGGPTGMDVVKSHMDANPKATSNALKDAGVPGIKYLDQSSRSEGEGTQNFVVFDHGAVEITHKNGEPVHAGGEGLNPGGADVTRPENLPTLEEQPPPAPGRLVEAVRNGADQLLGLGRNIQFMLDPMATGSKTAMVIAKDAISTVRRIRWEHARDDAEIMRRFDSESQIRQWNAADEESVALQLGESRENQGLVTLTDDERRFVEYAQGKAQAAWLHARDVGMVEGEGLPAYTPRMVLNVAAASEHGGPQALNELGRNVFTRTSQMLHRKYMMAEETEAAAKAMVAKRMGERGASAEEIAAAVEKVEIARNIRSLPLATARLEEAAAWKEMINKIEDVGKAAGNDTVAVGFKPDNTWFTIAGNPAFTKWQPQMERNPVNGQWGARLGEDGAPLMVSTPIYMHPDFRGPMTSILDEGASKSKVVRGAASAYGALMTIKGKSMQAILNSPLIHNEVVWSKVAEAAGGREWLGFGLYFKGNRIVNGNPARASELIERGLNPMGPRGSIQDITAMMEEPNLRPGRSFTATIARAVPDLFSETAGPGDKVGRAIDKMGDFYHNTLLWDRVRDVQFGLADHLSDRLVAKGADRITADRIASHFSNIIVGSIPKEAMSSAARATANMLLFSRSFTLGNLATFKQAALGLPKPILAQIERDFGMSADAAVPPEAAAEVSQTAKSIARRKAISTIALSAGLYYTGNAVIQHAFNIAARDSTLDEEMQGYARRYRDLMSDAAKDPFELRHLLGRLSPTYDNEPQKQDRAHIGYDKDGTAIYARNPTGKFGEEMVGYPTQPMSMLKRKLSPLAGGMLDILENDKGFGRKIYDENDTTIGGDAATAFAVAKYLVMKHLPEGQISAAVDLLRGEGDPTVNKLRVFGPMAGFTASVGAPGGMARGEQLSAKAQFDARFGLAWPDIKKQVLRGDEDGARAALMNLGVPMKMQNGLIRNATNPSGALKGRTLQDFYQYSTEAQRQRMDNAINRP